MAHALTNVSVARPAIGPSVFARLRSAFLRRAEARRIHGELSRLTDRELADIGLSRWQINDVAREAVQGIR